MQSDKYFQKVKENYYLYFSSLLLVSFFLQVIALQSTAKLNIDLMRSHVTDRYRFIIFLQKSFFQFFSISFLFLFFFVRMMKRKGEVNQTDHNCVEGQIKCFTHYITLNGNKKVTKKLVLRRKKTRRRESGSSVKEESQKNSVSRSQENQ